MNLRRSSDTRENGQAYIACIYAAGQAKHRMTWAELSDTERSEARHIAASQRCPIGDAASIVRRSRR